MEDPSILLLVWLVPSQSTSARSVVNTLPQVLIFPDTNKPTRSWPQKQPSPATSATKCMSQPQLFRCIFSLIIFHTNVMFVAKLSPDPGCYKDTWEVTLERNPMVALIVARSLLTDQTWELTCRLTTRRHSEEYSCQILNSSIIMYLCHMPSKLIRGWCLQTTCLTMQYSGECQYLVNFCISETKDINQQYI